MMDDWALFIHNRCRYGKKTGGVGFTSATSSAITTPPSSHGVSVPSS